MGSTKIRTLTCLAAIGADQVYGCHNCDIATTVRGLKERVFFVQNNGEFVATPQPQRGAFDARLSNFRDRLVRSMPSTSPMSTEQFVDTFRGRKRAMYLEAAKSLRVREVERRDSYLKTFVKIEKLNMTAKPDPVPRVIQPRSPRYNVELGKFLRPIEKLLYRGIDSIYGGPVVVKGMNSSERGKLIAKSWAKFENPVAIGLDAKRFDQHVSVDALEWEHSIYKGIYSGEENRFLSRLLRWQVNNRGFVNCEDGWAKYNIDGCRMSGDMNTSLGNVILMCGMMWSYLSTKGINYRFINDGDDCVLIVERGDAPALDDLEEWFLGLGFEMERDEPAYVLEKIVFCQCQPVVGSDGTYVMMRDPRICTAKDSITTKCLRPWEYDTYRRSIADCGIALAGDMPVLGAFYECLGRGATINQRLLDDCRRFAAGLRFQSQGMAKQRAEPTPQTRVSFYRAFDIIPDRQIAIEAEYDKILLKWCSMDQLSNSIQPLDFMRFRF